MDSQFDTEAREVQRNSACGLEQGQGLVKVQQELRMRTLYLLKNAQGLGISTSWTIA